MTRDRAYHTRRQQARQTRQQQVKRHRLERAREHLQREQTRAQRYLRALEQAMVDLGLPEVLAADLEWRLNTLGKLLGKIFGLMFPTLFGCQTIAELTRVRRWDKNLPAKLLGALPKRTWVGDDRIFKKSGQQLGLVGTWYSGQEHRVRLGIDGLLLVVVIGEGKLVIPVDFTVRRPDPRGPGAPGRDKLTWLQVMLDRTWAALGRRCRRLPPPLVVADSWFGDSKLLAHVALHHRGTMLVEGKRTYVFHLRDGRRLTGQELVSRTDWPWRDSPQVPWVRYVRLTATSPTYGPVTVVIVDEPGQDRYDLLCRATTITVPRLIRAWKRRSWIEHHFRILKHLLAAEACQVHSEDAYYGHLVLRLLAALVLLDTARILCKGRVTMEEIVFSLKHHWRFLNSNDLGLHALSWDLNLEAA